jgi:hypothetical protein
MRRLSVAGLWAGVLWMGTLRRPVP